jgi:hypothetical protein
MIKKYSDFINENLDLILESDVKYSEQLRKVIKKIGGPVSDTLLEIENKDYPVQSNYFDITPDKNDTISFTPDRKVKEILDNQEKSKGEEKWRYMIQGRYLDGSNRTTQPIWDALGVERTSVDEPPVGSTGTLSDKEAISPTSGNTFVLFTPDDTNYKPIVVNKVAIAFGRNDGELPQPKFFELNRQTIRVGRGIRSILNAAKAKISDREVEEFVNKYKATIDNLNDVFSNFEVVRGDAIAHWYSYENNEEGSSGQNGSGTLGSSCMSDVESEFFDIYCENPDKVGLVIYKSPDDPEKIRGRALLWNLDNGKIFMDRIYTHKDSDVELFRQYGKKNGWWCKANNSSTDSGNSINPENDKIEGLDVEATLKNGRYDKYPYLDTLKYYNAKTGLAHNSRRAGDMTLEDTGGGTDYCDTCDGEGEIECSDCDGDGHVTCNRCDGDKEVACEDCDGDGRIECSECDGTGNTEDENGNKVKCPECKGIGKINCEECSGKGKIECSKCDGEGEIECDECNNGRVSCPECG